MKLLTKAIREQALKQYPLGSDMESQNIVAKFFDPTGEFTWYLMNIDPEDEDYCWGIVDGFAVEAGSFSLCELREIKLRFGLGIERDLYFEPVRAIDLWKKLQEGK